MNKTTFISLSSGSDGNCYYFGNSQTAFIIDTGVSSKTLIKKFKEHKLDLSRIQFILITHDHIDHIKHLTSYVKKFNLPIYTTDKLHNALLKYKYIDNVIMNYRKLLEINSNNIIHNVDILPFEVPHDSTQNLSFFIKFNGNKILISTDIGRITNELVNYGKMAETIIIESNYDRKMLLDGKYSGQLKSRISSGSGHLSNCETAEYLKSIYNSSLKRIYLCHLSSNNNTPELAYNQSFDSLTSAGVSVGKDLVLLCLPRREFFITEF